MHLVAAFLLIGRTKSANINKGPDIVDLAHRQTQQFVYTSKLSNFQQGGAAGQPTQAKVKGSGTQKSASGTNQEKRTGTVKGETGQKASKRTAAIGSSTTASKCRKKNKNRKGLGGTVAEVGCEGKPKSAFNLLAIISMGIVLKMIFYAT